ncbi:hypothetical protein RND81_02G026300 [Saponaria officinalis]|uniref:Uncharacterized protein n=1 Tax=Saponaria officinalis TaxID=3572 RepID=A0AAW1MPU7_SAPOF
MPLGQKRITCLNISERKHKSERKCKFFCSTLGYLMLAKENNLKSFKNIMKNELEAFGFSDLKSIKMMEPLKTLRAKYVCSMISMEENVHGKRVIDQAKKHHEQKTKELESTGS